MEIGKRAGVAPRRKALPVVVGLILLVLMEGFFFRNVLFSNNLIGDAWDGRLTMLFTEHWFHVFRGEASVVDMGFFYPAQNTLAYSDMFLGFGIIHSLFRMAGLDIFLAYKATIICVHLIGTIATFILLYKCLGVDVLWSLFGTTTFSFSSTFALHIGHTQLAALSLVPLLAIFLVSYFKHMDRRKLRWVYALLAIAVLMLILYTAWYIFFFTVLFVVTGLIVGLCRLLMEKREYLRAILQTAKGMWVEIALYALIAVLLMVPFARLELPILKLSGGRSYGEVCGMLPEAIDYLNVSTNNWLLGPLIAASKIDERGYSFEVQQGFSIILVLVFLVVWLSYRRKRDSFGDSVLAVKREMMATLVMTVIVNCLLLLRLSANGVSLWWGVFHLFPGATSVRAVARYLMFLSLPLSVVTACMGEELSGKAKRERGGRYAIIMIALLGCAFIANIRTDGVMSAWNREGSRAFVESVPEPPADCEVFFLSDVIEGQSGPYYQVDAYQIADRFGIKTIHGYSGLEPQGWGPIWDVKGPMYRQAVSGWITRYHLENVYAYDEVKRTWTKYDLLAEADPVFDVANNEIPDFITGIWDYQPEGEYSWTDQDFSVTLRDEDITYKGLLVKVGTVLESYLQQQPDLKPECTLYVNGKSVGDIPVIDGTKEYRFAVDAAENDLYNIEIKTNCHFVPADIGQNGDTRDLSLQLYYLGAAS